MHGHSAADWEDLAKDTGKMRIAMEEIYKMKEDSDSEKKINQFFLLRGLRLLLHKLK